jgi:hypothetical protein
VQNIADGLKDHCETKLRNPVKQTILVRMLCGIVLTITTFYCAPTRNNNKDDNETEIRRGLYPELAAYGFAKKSSPALENRVVRAAVLYSSFELAQRELADNGLELDTKEIRRLTLQCGERLLSIRCEKVKQFLSGKLKRGNELRNRNVVVEEDGGRIRQRENIETKSKKAGKHPKFRAEWREPKLFIIYCVDENGKKEKSSRVFMDATFQGADHAAELLAAKLYELGADQAKSVTFIADGANCLWNRFDWIVEAAQINRNKVEFVLDFFHASHHLSQAIAELGYNNKERRETYKRLRHDLRQSRWEDIVSELKDVGKNLLKRADLERNLEEASRTGASNFLREVTYLEKHGESGHLSYVKYTRRGLPLGSVAVESAIRRVINLRLKSNGMFCRMLFRAENAEKILQVRCQVLSTEWSECRRLLRSHRSCTRNLSWRWSALDRSRSLEKEGTSSGPTPTKCRNSSLRTP